MGLQMPHRLLIPCFKTPPLEARDRHGTRPGQDVEGFVYTFEVCYIAGWTSPSRALEPSRRDGPVACHWGPFSNRCRWTPEGSHPWQVFRERGSRRPRRPPVVTNIVIFQCPRCRFCTPARSNRSRFSAVLGQGVKNFIEDLRHR